MFVGLFNKTVLFLLWGAIMNLLGNSMFVLKQTPNFALGYKTLELLFSLIYKSTGLTTSFNIIVILLSAAVSAIYAFLTMYAKRAKLWALLVVISLYLVDTILAFIPFSHPFTNRSSYLTSVAIHVVIISASFVALFSYANVITINKQYPNLREKSEE
jgi:uncharacterized membrane protein YpjA